MNESVKSRAADLWAQGKTVDAIARDVGLSRSSIAGMAYRDRTAFPQRKTNNEERTAALAQRRHDAKAMFEGGKTRMEIARHFGVTHSAVKHWLVKGGIAPKRRLPTAFDFIAHRVELAAAWAAGNLMDDIAKRFGISKGMLAGYAVRNRDVFPERSRGPAKGLPARRGANKNPTKSAVTIIPSQSSAALLSHGFQLSGGSQTGKPLWDLTHKCCRWPVNAAQPGEAHLFCGEAIGPDHKSYCANHAPYGRTTTAVMRLETAANHPRGHKQRSARLSKITGAA